MLGANALYQTVLLIKVDVPDAAMNPIPAAEQPPGRHEALAFVQERLLKSGMCRESWIAGTGLVALLDSAAAALKVACSVQQACAEHSVAVAPVQLGMLLDRPPDHGSGDLQHSWGRWSSDHAERLLQQLPAGQIFASRAVAGHFSEALRAGFRLCEAGGAADNELYQVVCHEETITRLAVPTLNQDRMAASCNLFLRWRDASLTLTPESPSLSIGRGDQCDINIDSDLASRVHARLGFHETNFILADQSTNGTFVQIEDDEEVCLWHQQIVLRGRGVISLGRRIRGGRGKLIYFNSTR
jgi:hypothetical protein